MSALAESVLAALRSRGLTLATAESLTGGLVCARLVDVPGASDVVRGAIVAYATEAKAFALGVDADLLADRGPVHPDVARAMAAAVRVRLRADVGLSTTGVAGPGPADGHEAGTVYVALSCDGVDEVRSLRVVGDRSAVREAAVQAVLELARGLLARALPAPVRHRRDSPRVSARRRGKGEHGGGVDRCKDRDEHSATVAKHQPTCGWCAVRWDGRTEANGRERGSPDGCTATRDRRRAA